jgi:hypothetical protein
VKPNECRRDDPSSDPEAAACESPEEAMHTTRVSLTPSRAATPSRRLLALLLGLSLSGAAGAGFLNLPNGDLSAPANAGSVGGGLVGASGTDVLIGSGPWTGSYNGVLGLLAPPTLEISSVTRTATITGVLGINALGIVNNGGHFGQTLTRTWQANKRYTVISHLNVGAVLDLPLLSSAGTGISLHAGAVTLTASTTAAATHARADAADAATLRLQLTHDNLTALADPIHIRLFDRPVGLLTASLVDEAQFSGMKVAESTIPPANSSLTVSGGGGQGAAIGQPFPNAMRAVVRDQGGNPVPDVMVTLAAPEQGASATLTSGSESGRVIVAFTDSNGEVILGVTANEIAGCYIVSGEVLGVQTQAVFRLRNYTPEQIHASEQATGVLGVPQDSVYCNGFE